MFRWIVILTRIVDLQWLATSGWPLIASQVHALNAVKAKSRVDGASGRTSNHPDDGHIQTFR